MCVLFCLFLLILHSLRLKFVIDFSRMLVVRKEGAVELLTEGYVVMFSPEGLHHSEIPKWLA